MVATCRNSRVSLHAIYLLNILPINNAEHEKWLFYGHCIMSPWIGGDPR